MFTYIQAIDLLEQFAQKHLQLRSMGAGDLPDIESEKLILRYDSGNPNNIVYPLLWAVPKDTQIESKETLMKIQVSIMDLVNDDNHNVHEVLSDTLQIHHDLFAALQYPDLLSNYILQQSFSISPFTGRFDAAVTGWDAEYTFRISNLRDRCAAVMTGNLEIIQLTIPTP